MDFDSGAGQYGCNLDDLSPLHKGLGRVGICGAASAGISAHRIVFSSSSGEAGDYLKEWRRARLGECMQPFERMPGAAMIAATRLLSPRRYSAAWRGVADTVGPG